MSHGSAPPKRSSRPDHHTTFVGLPTWSGPSVVFASLATGLLLSLLLGEIALPYQLLFIVGSLGVTLLVEARGLFLTVSSIPVLFGIFTPATAWFISQQGIAGGQGVSATAILTAIYPLAEMFPTLIMVTLVAALIAVVRIALLRRNQQNHQVTGEQARRTQREANRANATVASRARAQSTKGRSRRIQEDPERAGSQVTVDELIRRGQQRRHHVPPADTPRPPRPKQPTAPVERRQAPPPPRVHRSLDDDLYN